jgi:sugar (pentulose or hexulose) kinase
VDLGSTLCKAAVCDAHGQILSLGHTSSPPGPAGPSPDACELAAWWQATRRAVARCLIDLGPGGRARIRALGVSCRYFAGVFLDAADHPVAASPPEPVWRETPEVREVYEGGGWGPAGPLACGYGPILVGAARRFRHRHPNLHRRVQRVGALHDYIVLCLTGAWVTDYATGPGGPSWPDIASRLAGVKPSAFPAPLPMHARAGPLRPGPATDLGLIPNIPVAVGGQDGACANFGAGAVEPGDGCITLSTNAVVRIVTGTPIAGEFGYVIAPSGSWAWVRGVPGAGRALDAVVAALDGEPAPAESSRHRALTPGERPGNVPRVLDLPEADVPRIAHGVRLLREQGCAREAIYAGAVDDVVNAIMGLVGGARRRGGTARRYVLTGGMTAAPLLCERLAAALDAREIPIVREAAAGGAAQLAAIAAAPPGST